MAEPTHTDPTTTRRRTVDNTWLNEFVYTPLGLEYADDRVAGLKAKDDEVRVYLWAEPQRDGMPYGTRPVNPEPLTVSLTEPPPFRYHDGPPSENGDLRTPAYCDWLREQTGVDPLLIANDGASAPVTAGDQLWFGVHMADGTIERHTVTITCPPPAWPARNGEDHG